MKKSIMRGAAAVAVLVASATAATQASAQEIGKLNIVGTVDIFQVPAGPIGNVVIDFIPPSGGGTGVVETQAPQTGIFAILPQNDFPGTNIDFVFGPLPGATTPPVVILTIGGFTFTATSFGPGNIPGLPISLNQVGTTVFAELSVQGTLTGPGAPLGTYFLGGYSTQFPNTTIAQLIQQIESGTVVPSSISASFVALVPEPSTYMLMATGLIALAGAAYRRRTA